MEQSQEQSQLATPLGHVDLAFTPQIGMSPN